MALRMMLGRNFLQKAAPATTRFFRAAAVSMKIPDMTDEELAEKFKAHVDLKKDELEGMTPSQITSSFVAKLEAENPDPPSTKKDILKEKYYKQQRDFRALYEKLQDIEIPFDGDKYAIAEYAKKRHGVLLEVRVWQLHRQCKSCASGGVWF